MGHKGGLEAAVKRKIYFLGRKMNFRFSGRAAHNLVRNLIEQPRLFIKYVIRHTVEHASYGSDYYDALISEVLHFILSVELLKG
jgi:hypothetical protein